MGKNVAVTFYAGIRPDAHIIDHLNQPEVSVVWEPALADIHQSNIAGLMRMANISPTAWRKDLVARFGFDVLNPTEEGLRRVGVPADRMRFAMEAALEQKENWEINGDIDDAWTFDPDLPQNMTPRQVYEVLAETGARGTPVVFFQADEDDVMAALAEDNLVTVSGENGVFIGLSDPVNGYNWSPERMTGEITFRPSTDGLVVIGDDHLLQYAVDDAYTAEVRHSAAPELRVSSRSEETARMPPPKFRDERVIAAAVAGARP